MKRFCWLVAILLSSTVAGRAPGQGAAAGQATLNVTAPPGATLRVADFVSRQTGAQRTYFVPNLVPGFTYWLELEAAVPHEGKTKKAVQKVQFKAGETVAVDLTKAQYAAARVLLITESRGFRHGCVTRKVTVNPKADLSKIPSEEGLELQINNKDGKASGSFLGRIPTPQNIEIRDNDTLLVKIEPCVVEKTFMELAAKTGLFHVVCSQDSRREITAENLKNFDAVFFYTTGELPLSEVQKSDLLAYVRSGKGFGGSHCATDTFYKWKEYGDLIGGYFDGHPWHQKIRVVVEDRQHPATRHLGESFEITDEIYQFKGPYSRDKLHILMKMDMQSVKNPGKRADGDNALAWVHQYGQGRVFYTALGHRDEVWRDERFQQHVIGGLRYMFGWEKADATPSAAGK